MTIVFKLPDLGEGLQDAEIVEWHAAAGDRVERDQPLVSVETDKAVVEVPSPHSGTLARTHGGPGDIIKVGQPLAEFDADEESDADTRTEDSGTVVGKVETRSTVIREAAGGSRDAGDVKAMPAVRALAKRMNVDLTMVRPSGPDGLVTADDVKRAASILAELGPVEPLRGVRRAMARTMTLAHEQVAPVSLHDDADVEHWPEGVDVTLRLIRALVAGCRAEPGLNAWYDAKAVGRHLVSHVDLGIAVDTEDGLFVPVLNKVDQLDDAALRAELDALKTAVVERSIAPEQMRGATITLSNFGTFGGRYATPVVVPPSVAILGVGAIRSAVVPADGGPAVHRVLPLSLTFDHRCITGGEAGRFLNAVIRDLGR